MIFILLIMYYFSTTRLDSISIFCKNIRLTFYIHHQEVVYTYLRFPKKITLFIKVNIILNIQCWKQRNAGLGSLHLQLSLIKHYYRLDTTAMVMGSGGGGDSRVGQDRPLGKKVIFSCSSQGPFCYFFSLHYGGLFT